MSKYFSNFPDELYNGMVSKNILKRTSFLKETIGNPFVFLPYIVKDGEKPEDIAYHYYGSVDYTWLVLLSNSIIDPYFEWPISSDQFESFLIKKYSDKVSENKVLDWTRTDTLFSNIVCYYNPLDANQIVSSETFLSSYIDHVPGSQEDKDLLTLTTDTNGFLPIRVYEWEILVNDSKREITLLSNTHKEFAEKELKRLLKL